MDSIFEQIYMGTSLLNRIDKNLLMALQLVLLENQNHLIYFYRSYLVPYYAAMLCRRKNLSITEINNMMTYLAVIEASRKKLKATFPMAWFSVYYTLSDLDISENLIPVFNDILNYLLFGNDLFESVVDEKILAKASNYYTQAAKISLKGKIPFETTLSLRQEINRIHNRLTA